MTYRNDQEALNNRKEQLEKKLQQLREKIREGNEANKVLTGTVKELEELYAEYNSYTAKGTKKRSLPLLQRIYVASPCNVPWESMTGDEHVRHCASCDKKVYDLSSLTTAEAEQLLQKNDNICAQYYRREDGTILTADCPVGVEKKKKNRRKAAVIAATIASTVAGAAVAATVFSRDEDQEESCSNSNTMVQSNLQPQVQQTLPVQVTDKPPQGNPMNQMLNVSPPRPEFQRTGGAVAVRPAVPQTQPMLRGDVAFK